MYPTAAHSTLWAENSQETSHQSLPLFPCFVRCPSNVCLRDRTNSFISTKPRFPSYYRSPHHATSDWWFGIKSAADKAGLGNSLMDYPQQEPQGAYTWRHKPSANGRSPITALPSAHTETIQVLPRPTLSCARCVHRPIVS